MYAAPHNYTLRLATEEGADIDGNIAGGMRRIPEGRGNVESTVASGWRAQWPAAQDPFRGRGRVSHFAQLVGILDDRKIPVPQKEVVESQPPTFERNQTEY